MGLITQQQFIFNKDIINRYKMKKIVLVFYTIYFLSSFCLKSFSLENKNIFAVAISDIHFDPLYDCEKLGVCEIFEKLKTSDEKEWNGIFFNYSGILNSKYTQDTNYSLLKNILIENKNSLNYIVSNNYISFIIANGDFLGHNLKQHYYNLNKSSYDGYSDFVRKTIKFVTDQIKSSLSSSLNSSIIVFPVLGNNDSYVDDYFIDDADSNFYIDTAETWSKFLPEIKSTNFIHNGFYSWHIPELNSNFIVLDSTLFSENAASNDKIKMDLEAKEQLNWLNNELHQSKIKGQKTILAFHIPSSVDPYLSSVAKKPVMFWKAEYQKIFLDSINQYRNEIIAIFNSHIHSDALYVDSYKKNNEVELFSTLIPSISPAHSNNPSFKIVHFSDDTSKNIILKDIDTYFYDISKQNNNIELDYEFNKTYKSKNVRSGINNLLNGNLYDSYFKYYNLNTNFVLNDEQKYYICAIKFVTESEYQSCINEFNLFLSSSQEYHLY